MMVLRSVTLISESFSQGASLLLSMSLMSDETQVLISSFGLGGENGTGRCRYLASAQFQVSRSLAQIYNDERVQWCPDSIWLNSGAVSPVPCLVSGAVDGISCQDEYLPAGQPRSVSWLSGFG